MNSSTCEGPCVFPWAIGILIISNVDNMSVKLCCQVLSKGGTGGSIKRKSSKIWQTNEILHLLSRIHLGQMEEPYHYSIPLPSNS
jgi:hypothetical protein